MKADQNFLRLIGDLDDAIFAHQQWLKRLHRSLICGDKILHDDLQADAHRRCRFGVWYYDARNDFMRDDPGFLLIDELHAAMHDGARGLLSLRLEQGHVGGEHYDGFINSANHFKQHVREVQYDLIGKVCLIDHLTGTWNRYAMAQQLERELERMQRTGHPCCLAMMDIDHFKHVNDTHGHKAGDLVLHRVMEFFSASLRKYDTVGRFGGEEFLVCLPNTDEHLARVVLDRSRADIADLVIRLDDGQSLGITASFGIAPLCPDLTIEDVIHMADHALLAAKAGGRNRVVISGEQIGQ